jgi:hypothetical protein
VLPRVARERVVLAAAPQFNGSGAALQRLVAAPTEP